MQRMECCQPSKEHFFQDSFVLGEQSRAGEGCVWGAGGPAFSGGFLGACAEQSTECGRAPLVPHPVKVGSIFGPFRYCRNATLNRFECGQVSTGCGGCWAGVDYQHVNSEDDLELQALK